MKQIVTYILILLFISSCNTKRKHEKTNNLSITENIDNVDSTIKTEPKVEQKIKFTGLYQSEKIEKELNDPHGYWNYLRFYENNHVRQIGSENLPKNVFDLRYHGKYLIEEDSLKFEIKSTNGSVFYKGQILKNGNLKLHSKSMINGNESNREYTFVNLTFTDTVYEEPEVYNPCDSTKLKTYKTNLKELDINQINQESIEKAIDFGNQFIKEHCKSDSLYCDSIYIHEKKLFAIDSIKVYSFGYRFYGNQGYESNSNSFYTIWIYEENELRYQHTFEELIGEIIVNITGIESDGNGYVLYGEEYPYFSNDYGRFRMEIQNERWNIVHECREVH
ncbi:hypothetical protein [Carboxylicivirga taeanensis]|uniref:hypothetical protein n=1 Tax=Carboxylicivirga taeanensis TaxID=1416875 RepID=UPI003F6E19F7